MFKSEIAEGMTLVGLGEAVPIEEAVCDADQFLNEAYTIISMVNEGIDCVEVKSNLLQFGSYWNSHTPSDQYFDTDVGAFAGQQYKYVTGCEALTKNLAKTAWSKVSSSYVGLADIDD